MNRLRRLVARSWWWQTRPMRRRQRALDAMRGWRP